MRKDNAKIDVLYFSLIRKGLITEQEKLTVQGNELLSFISSKEEKKKIVKRKPATVEFDSWWKEYPGTDNFEHKGHKFTGSRTLRTAKEDCKTKFQKILDEGEYTAAELTEALKTDVLIKKENSFKTKTNKLSYMQNSLTYLNQRSYEAYIEMLKEGLKIEESNHSSFRGTDI